jgi:N-acetylglucosamine kinase
MLTTLKPGYYLGIDGGGTKTEAVIATESGLVLGRGTAGGANPHNYPLDVAFEHIRQAVEIADHEAHEKRPDFQAKYEAACIGMAGIDTDADRNKVSQYFQRIPYQHSPVTAGKIILCNDGFIGLKSGTDENWGICLIASTGSNCYGVDKMGKEFTAGDWGYLLGDQGSGYAMGIEMIRNVIKEFDGRKPPTLLTEKVIKHLGMKQVTDLIPWAYSGQVPVRDIASLSQLYNDPELADSIDLSEIINNTMRQLIIAYQSVSRRLDLGSEVFTVVLLGGLFNLKNHFFTRIKQSVKSITPTARIIQPTVTPAEGAVKVAQMGNLSKLFPESVVTYITPAQS